MKIASFQSQSLIEYPEKISAVIFLTGCNFRCQYCYVPDLVLPERIKKIKGISERKTLSFLKERKKFLDAVVISGGEPTIHKELPDFIKKIKNLGYSVGLATNGSNSEMLNFLINNKLIDYVAMDIKQDLDFKKYNKITGGVLIRKFFEHIKRSIKLLLKGEINYEFRTTLIKEFHKKEDIIKICKKIAKANIYYLQNFEKTEGKTISGKIFTPFPKEEILEIIEEGKKYTNIKSRLNLA